LLSFASASSLAVVRWQEDYHLFLLGMGSFIAGSIGRLARRQRWQGWARGHRMLAACYAHMGRLAEARDLIERLRPMAAVMPPLRRDNLRPEDRELMRSGLRLAMGETE